jgi:hypothetical protein
MLNVEDVFQAEKAIEKMQEILVGYPKAVELAREVDSFFGHNFYLKGKIQEPSSFGLGYKGSFDPKKDSIEISLVPSCRCQAALVHELLHGKLIIDGYPWLILAAGWHPFHVELPNIVYHELMIDQYLALGLAREDFIIPSIATPLETIHLYNDDSRLGYIEWLYQWHDWRLTKNQQSEETAIRLRQQTADDTHTHEQLLAWFDGVSKVKPEDFEDKYDELSSIMKIIGPDRKQWIRLQPGPPIIKVIPSA